MNYPLVNQRNYEKLPFSRVNPLFQRPCSMSQAVSHYQRVYPINIPGLSHYHPYKTIVNLVNHCNPYVFVNVLQNHEDLMSGCRYLS